MAIERRPGDTDPKVRYFSGYYSDRMSYNNGNPPWFELSSGSVSFESEKDFRPTYEKGALITYPNGQQFRLPTNYSHESWKVGESSPAYAFGPMYAFPGAAWREVIDGGRDASVILNGAPALVRGIPTDMRNEAVTKALNELADQTANLSENLATLGQTSRMFASRSHQLALLLKAFRSKKQFREFWSMSYRQMRRQGIPESISSAYLEYVYGWKPLMQDIYRLHKKAVDESVPPLFLYGKGKSRRTNYSKRYKIATSYSDVEKSAVESNSKANSVITARINPEWAFLRSLNQLGLINPALLVWELVPYSFVVDWLIPVGSVLSAYSAPAGLDFVGGYVSNRVNESFTITYGTGWPDMNLVREGRVQYKPAIYPVTYEGYTREKLPTWPRPGLWIDPDPLRGDRIFKAAALAILGLRDGRGTSRY